MNRKARRAKEANARRKAKNDPNHQAERDIEERLHDAVHEAVAKVLKGIEPSEIPHQKIVRGLGMTAAAFQVQLARSLAADRSEVPTLIIEGRAEFIRGMVEYYDSIANALGVDTSPEPSGPTLVLP